MSRASPFNPADFQAKGPANGGTDNTAKQQQKSNIPYETTGNSSRDQVRKMLWEIFTQGPSSGIQAQSGQDAIDEGNQKFSAQQLVAMLEDTVFKNSDEDAKTRQYRDRCKNLQLKLKGPRFVSVRNELKSAALAVETVCSDEYLNSKAANTAPAGRGGLGGPSPRGRGMIGGPRGRGAMPPGMMAGRGRGGMQPGPRVPPFRPLPTAQAADDQSKTAQQEPEDTKQEEEDQQKQQTEPAPQEKREPVQEQHQEENQDQQQQQQEEVRKEEEKRSEQQKDEPKQEQPAAFRPPVPQRGKPPMRGMPPFRGRGGPPMPRGGGPARPPANRAPITRSSPLQKKEEETPQETTENMNQFQESQQERVQHQEQARQELDDTQQESVDQSADQSKIELEFPNSTIIADESLDNLNLQNKEANKNDDSTIMSEEPKYGLLNPEKSKDASNSYNDDSSQIAATSDNKLPQFEASLDDSMLSQSAAGDQNTSQHVPKKKKVKKIKKIKKKPQASPAGSAKQQKEIVKQIQNQSLNDTNTPFNSTINDITIQQDKSVEQEQLEMSIIELDKRESTDKNADLPLQRPVEKVQQIIQEEPAKDKPSELTPDEVEEQIKQRKESSQIGKLTQKNLQEQLGNNVDSMPYERDIDIESVQLDQSAFSPRGETGKDSGPSAQDVVQQVAAQLEKMPNEKDQLMVIDKHQNQQQSSKAGAGDQNADNTKTIKSKSQSHSAIGAQDSDAIRRLQETLQSKKETINELNQKYLSSQSDYTILQKKFKLVQDENQKLKEELSQQKSSYRQNEERVFDLNQQISQKEQAKVRLAKEKEEMVHQLVLETTSLKQERDLYKDRYQKVFKYSLEQRQKLERQMNTFNSGPDIFNILKNLNTNQVDHGQMDSSTHDQTNNEGGNREFLNQEMNIIRQGLQSDFPSEFLDGDGERKNEGSTEQKNLGIDGQTQAQPQNSASNYQEMNLQKELNDLRKKYHQQTEVHKEELDGVTRDLNKVQRLNDNYRENNRKLTDAVQSYERGNISSMAGSGAPNANEVFMNYQQMIDNMIEEDMDDEDQHQQINSSIMPSQQFEGQQVPDYMRNGGNETNNRQGIQAEAINNDSSQKIGSGQSQQHSQYQGSQQQDQNSGEHGNQGIRSNTVNQRMNYRNPGASYFENTQDEATGGESHHGFANSNANQNYEEQIQIADQQSALAQDNNTINDQSKLEQFYSQSQQVNQNNHQSSANTGGAQNENTQDNALSQMNVQNQEAAQNHGGVGGPGQSQLLKNDENANSGSVHTAQQKMGRQQNVREQNSAVQQVAMSSANAGASHGVAYSQIQQNHQHADFNIFDSSEQQTQNQSSQQNNGQSASIMQQEHAGSHMRDEHIHQQQDNMSRSHSNSQDGPASGAAGLQAANSRGQQNNNPNDEDGDEDDIKSDSEITEEDEIDDESHEDSRDDDYRDSQGDSALDEEDLDDDDDSEDSGGSNDPRNDIGQMNMDHTNDMANNRSGALGGAGGSSMVQMHGNDRKASDVGGLNSSNQHIGPGAIPSQSFPPGANNQNRNSRQTGSGGGAGGTRYGTHGNMPHQFQQNSQQHQHQQYGTGSSGASGSSVRGINQMQQHTQNQQNDEAKNQSSYYANHPLNEMHSASASGATGSGGVTNTSQRRNRRGNRQQNQQPSSGANGGENVNVRRSNRQHNNRQGRQTAENGASGGGGSSQMTNQDNHDVGAAHGHRQGITPGTQNERGSNPNSQSHEQYYYQTNNQDQRGRPTRTYNRGRQQRNNQQQIQGQNATASTQQSSSSQVPQQQPAPVSLSQEREQKAQGHGYNRFLAAGLGSGSGSAQEMPTQSQSSGQPQIRRQTAGSNQENQAVQQVIQMNAPASTSSQYSRNQQQTYHQHRQPQIQSSAIQGAASQTHMNAQSSQMIPASTASHSGGSQPNPFGHSSATQRGLSFDNQNNQQTTGAPHGGGGSASQRHHSNQSSIHQQNPTQTSTGGDGRNTTPHHNGVVHTVSFESGSTSFMDRQANSGLAAASEQSSSYPISQAQSRGGASQQQYQRPKNGVPFTHISQVSSPPSNNMNQMMGGAGQQRNQSNNQQNEMTGYTQNTPNSDVSGPGAVGAPPSSQPMNVGAINPAQRQGQHQRQSSYNANMPSSSGINESTQIMQMAAQQPHQQQQNISPGSTQMAGGQNNSSNSGPSQGSHQGQHINRLHGAPLPSVPENMRREEEEEKQSSHQSQLHQQQSIMTIPSSMFGGNAGVGGSSNANAVSQGQNANSMDGMMQHQTPAALQMVGVGQSDNVDASAGTGTAISINYNNASALFGPGYDDGPAPPQTINFMATADAQHHEQRATPPRRNNDSRKTSGANTPSKDGANTPTTHQSQSQQYQQNMQNRAQTFNNIAGQASAAGGNANANAAGSSQGQLPSGHSANEFGSAVTAGLNSHINNVGQGGPQMMPGSTSGVGMPAQIGGNNQQNNYVHNLTNQSLFGGGPANADTSGVAANNPNASAGGGPTTDVVAVGNSSLIAGGVSIIDQLSATAAQNRSAEIERSGQAASLNTASLFDDFINVAQDGNLKF